MKVNIMENPFKKDAEEKPEAEAPEAKEAEVKEEAPSEEAETLTYKRPSGSKITVGNTEANRDHAEANDWELIK